MSPDHLMAKNAETSNGAPRLPETFTSFLSSLGTWGEAKSPTVSYVFGNFSYGADTDINDGIEDEGRIHFHLEAFSADQRRFRPLILVFDMPTRLARHSTDDSSLTDIVKSGQLGVIEEDLEGEGEYLLIFLRSHPDRPITISQISRAPRKLNPKSMVRPSPGGSQPLILPGVEFCAKTPPTLDSSSIMDGPSEHPSRRSTKPRSSGSNVSAIPNLYAPQRFLNVS
jgi:hypothetical protein